MDGGCGWQVLCTQVQILCTDTETLPMRRSALVLYVSRYGHHTIVISLLLFGENDEGRGKNSVGWTPSHGFHVSTDAIRQVPSSMTNDTDDDDDRVYRSGDSGDVSGCEAWWMPRKEESGKASEGMSEHTSDTRPEKGAIIITV